MYNYNEEFDIIVIGGGHAGSEAAHIASKMCAKTLLLTMSLDTIGQMSCNPAIGGVAKGQIVREVDILGGLMAKVTDETGIHFKMLNTSKGEAVWSPRAQCDRTLYRLTLKKYLEQQKNLTIKQEEAKRIVVENNKVVGVLTNHNNLYKAKCVIVATGTFLNGLIHIGLKSFPAGRYAEFPSTGLSDSLKELGFEVKRLKTGTPPRIDGKTIDYSKLEIQPSDNPPIPFSHFTPLSKFPYQKLLDCYITYTNKETHKIILDNLDRSPLYTGIIKSIGPRYCPSIEDKVVKFKDRERHQIFLEPEGLYTNEFYCNGISSSLPEDVQEKIVHSIKGLENVKITRYGYAIEYDFCPPTQLWPSLETKLIEGLFFAGQINGTTGYEEAAGQGIIAGINAVLKIRGEEPLILGREEAYIGVLIDDLVTKGVLDPYRMFTSRAEYRLLLRTDNADLRLMKYAKKYGLVEENYYELFLEYQQKLEQLKKFFETKKTSTGETIADLIKQSKEFKFEETELENYKINSDYFWNTQNLINEAKIQIKYSGYIEKQIHQAQQLKKLENKKIPDDIDYEKIPGLLKEAKLKLSQIRPKTIGQASRISGVTPADVSILLVYLKKNMSK
ncbi:MAG: tRNA uridine-5-carboxymethylaminomethyl(34) synthesis enzyme MnmG [Elusimicrobiota bacterium]|nr:tRNA uridine-5-carboxymethylaminomethyl(34) synthesis enzyme MnmG [Elusimicrobiota bacterium]